MSYFKNLEEMTYSLVEYIPGIGTLYTVTRSGPAYNEADWKRFCQSWARSIESGIRDVILTSSENIPAILLDPMMPGALSSKLTDVYMQSSLKPKISIATKLTPGRHVIIAGPEKPPTDQMRKIYGGQAKGVYHFQDTKFSGVLTHPRFAASGTTVHMDMPEGMYIGAPVMFNWKWTVDSSGVKNSPDATLGFIGLEEGDKTRFTLTKRKGYGWAGYDFWGVIDSKNEISLTSTVGGQDVNVKFKRVEFK